MVFGSIVSEQVLPIIVVISQQFTEYFHKIFMSHSTSINFPWKSLERFDLTGFSTSSFAYFVEESCIHFLLEIILDLLTFLKHVLGTSTCYLLYCTYVLPYEIQTIQQCYI